MNFFEQELHKIVAPKYTAQAAVNTTRTVVQAVAK